MKTSKRTSNAVELPADQAARLLSWAKAESGADTSGSATLIGGGYF
jgi:hypothetical protein